MNILIVDAHPIFRAGLVRLVNELNVRATIFEARDPDEVKQRLAGIPNLDLVLADIPESEVEPAHRISTVTSYLPDVPVVMISAIESRECAMETIDMGAQGFIPKSASPDEFVQGLRSVLDGSVYLPKRIWAEKPTAPQLPTIADFRHSDIEGIASLTERERTVLELLPRGASNQEIAEELGISDKTVRFYMTRILKGLEVSNRTQAALIAQRAMRHTSQLREPTEDKSAKVGSRSQA